MKSHQRLYIITGKGGVGKTTVSRSFVRFLQRELPDKEVVYLTFLQQSLSSQHSGNLEKLNDGVKEIYLDLEDCAKNYIESKLGTKMIASWIVKTPFFRALVNMVPGFNYLIYLGQILQMQNDHPRLVVVLDAPASGHALTMIESTSNFKDIFGAGLVFEDTQKMLNLLNNKNYTKIHIMSLPSPMSWQEAVELKAGLKERTSLEVHISLNNCLYEVLKNDLTSFHTELPEVLIQKATFEKELIQNHRSEMLNVLPHSIQKSNKDIEEELIPYLKNLL